MHWKNETVEKTRKTEKKKMKIVLNFHKNTWKHIKMFCYSEYQFIFSNANKTPNF